MRIVVNGIDLGGASSVDVSVTPVIDPETGEALWRQVRLTATLPPGPEE